MEDTKDIQTPVDRRPFEPIVRRRLFMSNSSGGSSGGIGFVGLLTILFIALKLTGYVSWSWLWVLSPMWISLLVALAIVAVVIGVMILGDGGTTLRRRSR